MPATPVDGVHDDEDDLEEEDEPATDDVVEELVDDVVAAGAGTTGVELLTGDTDDVVVDPAVDDEVPLDVTEHVVDVAAVDVAAVDVAAVVDDVAATAGTAVCTAASLKSPPAAVEVPNVVRPITVAPPTKRLAATRRAPRVRLTLMRWLTGRGACRGAPTGTLIQSTPCVRVATEAEAAPQRTVSTLPQVYRTMRSGLG